jgi:hypothetical protein
MPFDESGLWLVRPDGYVALRATRGDARAVREYLAGLAAPGFSESDAFLLAGR